MNNNLDKLFQENLKNLEATPNKRVWNNIETKLKKKKNRLVPLWWFATGAAALFILGLLVFPISNNDKFIDKNDSNIITETPETELKPKQIKSLSKDSIQKKSILVAEENKILKSNKQEKKTLNKKEEKKKLVSTKNAMKKIFLANNSIKNDVAPALKKEETSLTKKNTDKPITSKEITAKVTLKKETKKIDINSVLEQKDSISFNKKTISKWSIAPVFAVLSSNSFSNSSPIDKGLSNSTIGKNSISYGVQVSFKLNKKWTIQSGVHLQEMSYVNNNVIAVSTISTQSSSISFNSNSSVTFANAATNQNSDIVSTSLNRSNLSGDLTQKYGYIEIPLEIKYNFLSSRKFNTQIVAGFSSLFLNKNEVNLNSQFVSRFGKATNLNNINFSGNLGFDFGYSLNKNWSLNLTPMFKAQLNTFSENSNGFSPFNIGIYSGIKYQF